MPAQDSSSFASPDHEVARERIAETRAPISMAAVAFVFVLPVVAVLIGMVVGNDRRVHAGMPGIVFAALAVFSMEKARGQFSDVAHDGRGSAYIGVLWTLVAYVAAMTAGITMTCLE